MRNHEPPKRLGKHQQEAFMTDIGNPIPRGPDPLHAPEADAPLVDEALAAREQHPQNDAADTVAALTSEVDRLKGLIAERHSEAAAKARTMVRDHPMSSLLAAGAVGYIVAMLLHGSHHEPERNSRYW
jgi:ElaB/YqjD/DUF883 family membrane-anchored ribosome-binding protein